MFWNQNVQRVGGYIITITGEQNGIDARLQVIDVGAELLL